MHKIMKEFFYLFNFAPIHYACEKGFFDIVQLLSSFSSCDVNLKSKYGILYNFFFLFYSSFECCNL